MTPLYSMRLTLPISTKWRKIVRILSLTLTLSVPTIAHAEDPEVSSKSKANTKPIMIESKVKGSQEQPKVLYIMPWQGITDPIDIENNGMSLILPEFRPINPKTFQKEVRAFQANQSKK